MVIGRSSGWLGLLVVLASCGDCDHGHDHPHGDEDHAPGEEPAHGHGHGHGDGPAVSITRWTDELELFAEHPPAVAGVEVTFLAHLTDLSDFSAIGEGQVSLVLEGPETVRAEAAGPLRPGIFAPRFTAPAAGTYRARLELRSPAVTGIVDGMTIEVHGSEALAAAALGAEEDGGDAISFLKEQQWRVPFATAFAERRTLVPTVLVAGEVTTPPGGSAQVGASVAGRVMAPPGGLPRPGETVRAGQLLATIAPAPSAPEEGARAGLAVAEADARLATAESELARAERLIADQAISERELEQARREVRVAGQAVAAARRAQGIFQGSASGRGAGSWRLTAPISGVITLVTASPGAPVSPEDVLFRIVDPSELWIRARVPEQDASRIRPDADGSYRMTGLEGFHPIDVTGEDATASVISVSPAVDPQSRTVDVIYSLAAPDPRLRVGALVRVAVPVGEARQGVAVPAQALLVDEGRDVVYVQVDGESFEERTVRIGARAGTHVEIVQGVDAGERVVTEGANLVRLSASTSAGGHGHVH